MSHQNSGAGKKQRLGPCTSPGPGPCMAALCHCMAAKATRTGSSLLTRPPPLSAHRLPHVIWENILPPWGPWVGIVSDHDDGARRGSECLPCEAAELILRQVLCADVRREPQGAEVGLSCDNHVHLERVPASA